MSSRHDVRRAPKYQYSPLPSYLTTIRGKSWKHTPTPWNWPSLWALLLGAVIQIAAGLVPTGISLILLVAADADRCPVAVGGARMRPFLAWVLGVIVGIYICEVMTAGKCGASKRQCPPIRSQLPRRQTAPSLPLPASLPRSLSFALSRSLSLTRSLYPPPLSVSVSLSVLRSCCALSFSYAVTCVSLTPASPVHHTRVSCRSAESQLQLGHVGMPRGGLALAD